ncbi:hypothetical protein MXD63_04005 [Frankia sp. Cpl3]|nr:hypothetical protein [Frankia sp. Cpl3]
MSLAESTMTDVGQWIAGNADVLALAVSVPTLMVGVYRATAWIRNQAARRADRRSLGEREFAVWSRLAENFGPADQTGSLTRRIGRVREDLLETLRAGLGVLVRERLGRPASGTVGLTYNDLFSSPDLLLETAFVDIDERIKIPAQGPIPAAPLGRFLVIGPAGTGKSALCRGLEYLWLMDEAPSTLWLTVDATDFVGDQAASSSYAGSREWLLDLLMRKIQDLGSSGFERRILHDCVSVSLALVIDGLDEIASLLGDAAAERFLESWCFGRAVLVTVRNTYHESVLLGRPGIVRSFHAMFSRPPDEPWILSYIETLSRRLFDPASAASHANYVKDLWVREPAIRALARNPLLLIMLVSTRGYHGVYGPIDVSSVFRQFVRHTLDRESRAERISIPAEMLTSALCELAWLRFRSARVVAGRSALNAAVRLADIPEGLRGKAVDALKSCPLLTPRFEPEMPGDEYDVFFYHKSFEEYFVARRVEDWIRGVSDRGSDFFERIDGPGVALFVRESVHRLSRDPQSRTLAAQRLRALLLKALENRERSSDERSARVSNFAAGRISYYLGALGDGNVSTWLADVVRREGDLWVRRSGAIGLAFGGAPDCLNEIIDETRAGIRSGNLTMARKYIAVDLGFYGDQEFDPLDPSADRGGDSCRRLVSRSVGELGNDVASWRVIVFNLTYLARHREISVASFAAEIGLQRDRLSRALQAIRADPTKTDYQAEISELEECLSALPTNPDR